MTEREAYRAIGARLDAYWAQARALDAPAGTRQVGGAHMDAVFAATALEGFLGARDKGLCAASCRARVDVREAVAEWNARCGGDYVLRRWDGCCDALIRDAFDTVFCARLDTFSP